MENPVNFKGWLKSLYDSLSYPGLVCATLFFAISLSPSLLPRPYELQGLLSGFALASGYGVGIILALIWQYAELPNFTGKTKSAIQLATMLICIGANAFALVYANTWQNDLRVLMGQAPDASANYIIMALIAIVLAAILLFFSRLCNRAYLFVSKRLNRIIPPRIANVLSVAIVFTVLISLANDLVVQNFMNAMDDLYSISDAKSDYGVAMPDDPLASGSPASLIAWDTLGREGQNFVTNGPKQSDLSAFFNEEVSNPLRVYVGLRSTKTVKDRAKLALDELIRVGGFERSKLIIATPTGTGWHDPSAVDPLEYLHRGDTAIVTMQYSYLPSWLTLLVDPTCSKVSANALYDAIYGYWTMLPKGSRPDLYIYGLSLGSLGAETSINLPDLIKDPIQGGVLAGPPFPSSVAPELSRDRKEGSPQWLPVIQDSSLVRYTAQNNALDIPGATWGPMRFVYIQYASDPMVFFSMDLYRREPDWLKGKRGHDVSSELSWYPIVTFLQILFDLPMADRVPKGNAHNYSASSYIDAWIAVTGPPGWDDSDILRLKGEFEGR
jgi:uncharacterized membrane protein